MNITLEQKAKYLNNPNNCPICNSSDLIGHSPTISSTFTIDRKIECKGCLHEWIEIFVLDNIINNISESKVMKQRILYKI